MTAPQTPRLGWLDALRGYAALIVVLFHLGPMVIGSPAHLAIFRVIDLGKYGVLLFFLVSGYVIPMSLERHGSLRRFWIGRLSRIYPAYLLAIVLVVVTTASIPAVLRRETVASVLAHATMLSDPIGLRGAVRPFWTLSYEMVFYLVVAGLFAWRLHRHSALWAGALAVTAVLAGPALPDALLSGDARGRRVLAAVLLVLVAGCVTAWITGRGVRAAGVAGVATVLVVAVNAHPTPQSTVASSAQGLLFLAVMIAGTVVYRTQHGQVSRRVGVPVLVLVGLCLTTTVSLATAAATAATFAAAFALRENRTPRTLARLGTISYSLYVLHVIVLMAYGRMIPHLADRAPHIRVLTGVAILVTALAAAEVSYRLVERPAQRLGRRLSASTRARPTERAAPGTGRCENGTGSV